MGKHSLPLGSQRDVEAEAGEVEAAEVKWSRGLVPN